MGEFLEILIKKRKNREKYFKNYLFWSKKIKKEAEKELGDVKVFVFGSILRRSKTEIPKDIDIMIISQNLKDVTKKSKIRMKISRKIGADSPFEIHLITPEDYRDWYSHFIKEEKIEI
jgi:predicted nucleotidyltransferase